MKPFDLNKHSSALKQRLRNALRKHEIGYAFKMSKAYVHPIKSTMETLRMQEEQFDEFVIRKQKEIDQMDQGIIKSKMQVHLENIKVQTYEHFSKLKNKCQSKLNINKDEEKKFNYPQN